MYITGSTRCLYALPVLSTPHSGSKYWGRKRRYQERPGTLAPYSGGVLRISVRPFRLSPYVPVDRKRRSEHFSGYALLEPGTISAVSRGTAY
jgi:hypothetical protein